MALISGQSQRTAAKSTKVPQQGGSHKIRYVSSRAIFQVFDIISPIYRSKFTDPSSVPRAAERLRRSTGGDFRRCQGCVFGGEFRIITNCPPQGRLAQLVRAPRSHRGGRRFKSSIAHQVEGTGENRVQSRTRHAEVAEWQTRCVQGAVSLRMCGFKSLPRHQLATRFNGTHCALVAQRIERCPAEAEVVSSNLAKRTISCPNESPLVPPHSMAPST